MISRRLPSIHGVDIYSVKSFLGQRRIETTERYLHFVAGHAEQAVRAAQEIERVQDLESGRNLGDIGGFASWDQGSPTIL